MSVRTYSFGGSRTISGRGLVPLLRGEELTLGSATVVQARSVTCGSAFPPTQDRECNKVSSLSDANVTGIWSYDASGKRVKTGGLSCTSQTVAQAWGQAPACMVMYNGTFQLVNDAGIGFVPGSLAGNSRGSLANASARSQARS